MFTGIIEELGTVIRLVPAGNSIRLTIEGQKVLQDVKLGDSIAVNGICLTVAEYEGIRFTADVMPETVNRTVLAKLKSGDRVNLERALRVGDRLGGHMVSGHIDGMGHIVGKKANDNAIIVSIVAEPDIMRYVVMKGSIAIDGASLTVMEINKDAFGVSIIPHTAGNTTVGLKKVGEWVNLETDIVGKYVEKFIKSTQAVTDKSKISMAMLRDNGFV